MQHRLFLGLLALFGLASATQAQYTAPVSPESHPVPQAKPPVVCPWITQGTVAKMLGGEVSVVANVSEAGEGVCTFSREEGSSDTLEIVVSKTAIAGCSADSVALRAIGNEAVLCTHAGPHKDVVQMISSRVRDQHFTVTITTHAAGKADKNQDRRDEPVYRIAEQVAGSLF